MKIYKKYIVFYALFLSCCVSLSQAADYTCLGSIDNINQNKNGTVSLISKDIYGDTKGRKICSLNSEWKSVSVEVCKAWLSKLFLAKAADKHIVVQYVDSLNCKSQPAWSSANAPTAFWEYK